MNVSMIVNGAPRSFEVAADEYLLDTLRRYGVWGVKRGCETGSCGACTVLIDGKNATSCLIFSAACEGSEVTTVEGVGDDIAKALVEVGAVQCGFCTPGIVLSTEALLAREPDPSEETIRLALDGNLCRCTGYVKIIEGVQLAASRRITGVAGVAGVAGKGGQA
jgi:aerobic-type carbon monoxide dehydrogenase small subunit (CoxS/CutS family)